MENIVQVHPLTNNPTLLWNHIRRLQFFTDIYVPQHLWHVLQAPPSKNVLRFVCMSDTHSKHLQCNVPEGDVFIHAGDFTMEGERHEVFAFNDWLGTLKHKYKIVIAGNHEQSFDGRFSTGEVNNARQDLTNCSYLEDSGVTICGVKIFGSPWQPNHIGRRGFKLMRGKQCLDKWNLIPADTDVLITHGPPLGHGDLTNFGQRAGCVELLRTVQVRVRPKSHIFGHIHEGYGASFDGQTLFVNASICDGSYRPSNPAFVFDVPISPGFKK
uniref:Calcineurin-like phosphoesterase domain-containing protein n=1 Tax=Dendroctonus ponderosae TaxID=77166 RepID=J3JX61_DENPD|nr:unknown [Dendroctonus ponderosae]